MFFCGLVRFLWFGFLCVVGSFLRFFFVGWFFGWVLVGLFRFDFGGLVRFGLVQFGWLVSW